MANAIKNQGRTMEIKITAPRMLENVPQNILRESGERECERVDHLIYSITDLPPSMLSMVSTSVMQI